MKKYLIGFWFSLPIQLLLLHFRRYQIFLLFWYILFATLAGSFMKNFGAESLYLAPEYFNQTNALSTFFVGAAIGIFIMSWNITTFILHSKHLKFLATTAQPFLKYCINNAIIPLVFLGFYAYKGVTYSFNNEYLSALEIILLAIGFSGGVLLVFIISFVYFFGADKTIYYTIANTISNANKQYDDALVATTLPKIKNEMRIDWFLSASLQLRKPRDVRHYSQDFIDSIFNRHHIAAVISILIAFVFLIIIGYSADSKLFQIPAAASITILFSILIGVAGAISSLFKTWSIPILLVIYFGVNYFYENEIIDPRNKAYGINYENKSDRPLYTKATIDALANEQNCKIDSVYFLQILNHWKAHQSANKPIAYIINTSGGGLRSAAFTMNCLQYIDSLFGGSLMEQTVLINGSSGGLLGAAYYRALFQQAQQKSAKMQSHKEYVANISTDLLNPLFSSFVTRDIVGPVQKFTYGGYNYAKDRGYAFEEKLNENTFGLLDKSIRTDSLDEVNAIIPLVFYNSIISRDGRKLIVSTHPVRFLMKDEFSNKNADAVDFYSFFQKQNSSNLRVLSALRMNATFPFVLPNVWLPTKPIIDVMDAGLRDNYGQETTLRFLNTFKNWFKENTSKVIVIQIRDRSEDDWSKPYEATSFIGSFTKPAFVLQSNWFKVQDFYQKDQLTYFANSYGKDFYKVCLQYIPSKKDAQASLSFHLTSAEKNSIADAIQSNINQKIFKQIEVLRK